MIMGDAETAGKLRTGKTQMKRCSHPAICRLALVEIQAAANVNDPARSCAAPVAPAARLARLGNLQKDAC